MGGGKAGGGSTSSPMGSSSTTLVGDIGKQAPTMEDTDTIQESAIDKKKMGTRGLQIPLASDKTATAATTGVQV